MGWSADLTAVAVDQVEGLEELLDRLAEAGEGPRVSLGSMVANIGDRSFGPLVLFAGLITLSPVGDIPGVPTVVAVMVVVAAAQQAFGRKHLWLPPWLLRRSVSRSKLCKAARVMARPARFLDRLVRPRWQRLTGRPAQRVIAVACVAIAVGMPLMEFVPFSASLAGSALLAFGLAMVARDGFVAALAFAMTGAAAWFVIAQAI